MLRRSFLKACAAAALALSGLLPDLAPKAEALRFAEDRYHLWFLGDECMVTPCPEWWPGHTRNEAIRAALATDATFVTISDRKHEYRTIRGVASA